MGERNRTVAERRAGRRGADWTPEGERLGLGERLAAARRRRGLRQLDVGREIGLSRRTIHRIEGGFYVAAERTRARVRAWLEAQADPSSNPSDSGAFGDPTDLG